MSHPLVHSGFTNYTNYSNMAKPGLDVQPFNSAYVTVMIHVTDSDCGNMYT